MEIRKTRTKKPPRILIHAEHGVGKSTLAASAPSPIFIQTEDGLDEINAESFPLCNSSDDILEQLRYVYSEQLEYKTLVIDSIDWCEKLICETICKTHNKKSMADFGYGSGYKMAYDEFCKIVRGLQAIREEKGMAIVLIAHSQVITYQNPLGADYDRFKIKLRDSNSELFLEWCDCVGFFHTQVATTTKTGGFNKEVGKAVGGFQRIFSCAPNAAYVSKNRYNIIQDIPVSIEGGFSPIMNAIGSSTNKGE